MTPPPIDLSFANAMTDQSQRSIGNTSFGPAGSVNVNSGPSALQWGIGAAVLVLVLFLVLRR